MEIVLPAVSDLAVVAVVALVAVAAAIAYWKRLATVRPNVGKSRRIVALLLMVTTIGLLTYSVGDAGLTALAYRTATASSTIPGTALLFGGITSVTMEVALPLALAAASFLLSRVALTQHQTGRAG